MLVSSRAQDLYLCLCFDYRTPPMLPSPSTSNGGAARVGAPPVLDTLRAYPLQTLQPHQIILAALRRYGVIEREVSAEPCAVLYNLHQSSNTEQWDCCTAYKSKQSSPASPSPPLQREKRNHPGSPTIITITITTIRFSHCALVPSCRALAHSRPRALSTSCPSHGEKSNQ